MQSLHQSQSIPITGIREIFFPAPRAVTLAAECLGITLRHENNYVIGKTDEDIEEMRRTQNLPEWVLPRFPLTDQHVKDHLKNEVLRNKKLAWVYRSTQEFSVEFRQRLAAGTIKSITDAKTEACTLYRDHHSAYDITRSPWFTSQDGRTHLATKKRGEGEKEHLYRRR